ncbi:cation:proton antiporter [Candidatus Gottesmanbacteria bacterium]|nr:cation:proton antiporter [Candidatus Gottesmanbacteria bacterium]
MQDFNLLRDLLVILITAFVFGLLAKRLKQPPITGYVIGGALISTFGTKLAAPVSTTTLIDFGVILLMFTLGIEFSFRRILRVKEVIFWGGIVQIAVFSLILSGLFIVFLNFLPYQSIYLALALSLSSTAIVAKLLFDRGEIDTLYGEILTGWLLIQDLAVIPIWVVMPVIWNNLHSASFSLSTILTSLALALLKTGAILYFLYWLGKKVVPSYLNKIAKINSRELFLIGVVLLISFLGIAASSLGLSPAIGAFVAGLLISETSQNHAIFAEIRPIRDILSIIFFVSLGLLFNLHFLLLNFGLIVGLTILVVILKLLISALIMIYFGFHSKTVFLTSVGIISVGEFAFVLARVGVDRGYLDASSYNLLLSITVLTMIIAPWAISLSANSYPVVKNFVHKFSPLLYEKFFTKIDQNKNFDEELPFTDHVVICGHGRVGKHISQILELAKIPYVVIDFNQKVISDLKKHAVFAIYGDPSDLDVLNFAKVDFAKVVVVAVPDRHSQEMIIQNSLTLNRNIVIICRSHFDEDRERLYALGAQAIVQPEFEAALHISGVLLNVYKFPREEIFEFLNKIRKSA